MDLDPLGLERGHEPVVLLADEREVGWTLARPVPAPLWVDQRLHPRVPGVGADLLELRAGTAHEHRA
jgi:hypothetical protein